MHPDLAKLMDLQRHDLEIKRLRDEIAAQPKQIATLEQWVKNAQQQRDAIVAEITKEEVLRRRQESDIADHRAKIARIRKQLDLATTTAQVTAFEHEIHFAQGEIAKLEDAELESMERTETLETRKADAEETVVNTQRTFESDRERSLELVALDRKHLETAEAERTAMRGEIGEDALSIYDRLIKSKGTAVSETLDQRCTSCQMQLRPQKWNELRDRDNTESMMTCESCGRLLYYDPARDAPQKKPVRQESIAASIVRSSI